MMILLWATMLALWGAIGLGTIEAKLAPLRWVMGFLGLSLVPGFAILAALGYGRMDRVESLLLGVGLSIAFLMALGFVLNGLALLTERRTGLSLIPLLLGVTFLLIGCTWLAAKRTKGLRTQTTNRVSWEVPLTPPALLFYLLPLLAVVGTLAKREYDTTMPLILMIGLIGLVPLLVATDKFLPKKHYPLAIFAVGIALLLHRSLVTDYLTGWDIHTEYYFQRLVLTSGVWDPYIPNTVNAMLGSVLLAPTYALVLDVSLVWVLKLVYPLLYTLVPLGLYRVFVTQTGEREAFLASFFFMATFVFFTEMLHLPRQQIAELFLVLVLLLLLGGAPRLRSRRALAIVFLLSLVVSHYALSYIFMFSMGIALMLLWVIRLPSVQPLLRRLQSLAGAKFGSPRVGGRRATPAGRSSTLSVTLVTIFAVASLGWYLFTSQAEPFFAAVRITDHLYGSLYEFLNPEARDPNVLIALGLSAPSVLSTQRQVYLALQVIAQGLLILGVFGVILGLLRRAVSSLYMALSAGSVLLLGFSVAVPFFSSTLNMSRIYHVSLILLAPFLVLGGRHVARAVGHMVTRGGASSGSTGRVLLGTFLSAYVLFSTGLVFELTGDVSTSISLDYEMDYPRYNSKEIHAAIWVAPQVTDASAIFADRYGWLLFLGYRYGNAYAFWGGTTYLADEGLIYLRCENVVHGRLAAWSAQEQSHTDLENSPFHQEVLVHRSLVYDNQCAQVYR